MDETPTRQLSVFFVAVLLIFLFFMSFAFFFLGSDKDLRLAAPGRTWKDLDDGDEGTKTQLPPARPLKSLDRGLPSVHRGRYVPATEAERAYFAAIDKAFERKARVVKRRERKEKLREFLASPMGQNLTATFELARRGRSDAAKNLISRLLEDISGMDVEIQRFVMQAAMSIYAHDKDKAGLARMMIRYLTLLKEKGEAGSDREELDEWIREISGRLGELDRKAGR